MPYITAEGYAELMGEPAPEDFDVLLPLAEQSVDRETLYGLWGREVSVLPAPIQSGIRQATAHQVQFLSQCGGLSAVNEAAMSSVTLGKFSYSGITAEGRTVSPLLANDLVVVGAFLRGLDR